MADYSIDAMYEIRRHLWNEIVSNDIIDPSDYYLENISSEIIPILPVQQQAEMDQFLSGKTHIVYDKISTSYEENWMICTEKMLFTIYSTDYNQINTIRNLMIDVFRRMDDSAKDLNASRSTDKLKFHSTYVAEITPTDPSEEMQGFLASDVILEVKYSRITGQLGRFD